MSKCGLLIDYSFCSGCQSCEVACKNEKGFDTKQEPWGIKVLQQGPWKLNEKEWQWDFLPTPTKLCDLCSDRVAKGEKPSCVLHCLANCLEYGTDEELLEKMNGSDRRMILWRP